MDRNFEDFNTLNEKIYNGARLVGVKQYYRQHRKGIHDKIENKLLPKNYQYPVGVQFELTYACNQKCIHCYNQSGGKHAEKEMSLDEWKKLAHRVGEMGVFQCIISGGEPTLLKEGLFEILDPVFDSFLSKKVSQPAILKACEAFMIFTITRYIIYFFYLIRC